MAINDVPARIALSVCVIGRNEGRHLAACAASLAQLAAHGITYESIFVDSASGDDSVAIAAACFDKVVSLGASPFLNAGAARRIATAEAVGEWVLYMDGDMELVADIMPALVDLVCSGTPEQGLCAFTQNVFPDGTRNLIHFRGNRSGMPCKMIGGTSVLPRLKVIEAGNWSAHLYAYEEAELYARLLSCGVRVLWHDCRLVEHKTPKVGTLRKVAGASVPYSSFLGKKFYGAGQATRLTLRNGNFLQFARVKPHAYLMTAGLLLGLAAAPFAGWRALLVPALTFGFNAGRLGIRGAVNYLCFQSQLAWGLGKLHPEFQPQVTEVRTRRASRQDCGK